MVVNNAETKPIIVTQVVKRDHRNRKKRCICETDWLLAKITGTPELLDDTQLNKIRLNLFTERNSDGSGYLVLRGKDIYDRYHRRIQDEDIRAICLYVRESPRWITRLDLCYNDITDVGFYKLLKKLLVKSRSSIINLNIMNNNLSEIAMQYLALYAPLMKLKYLRLNGNEIGTKGGEYIAKFLRDNRSVEYLDIGETNQTLSSVAHVITALRQDHGKNETVKVFDFSRIVPVFNRYSLESKWLAYHIEFLLERNTSIIELHLQKNEFIAHDMEYFARGLRRNNTLLYLDLGYNKIGDHGAEILADYLRECPQLLLLNIAGNGIRDLGARALSLGLPYSHIRALDISHNNINDEGIMDILSTIKKPYFMRFLNLWGNKITHPTCLVIERMLLSGVLFQHTLDIKLYEVDELLYVAYYPNPADRNKHLYYCELDFGYAQPIYHIKRNIIDEKKTVKVDCKMRHKLDKTTTNGKF